MVHTRNHYSGESRVSRLLQLRVTTLAYELVNRRGCSSQGKTAESPAGSNVTPRPKLGGLMAFCWWTLVRRHTITAVRTSASMITDYRLQVGGPTPGAPVTEPNLAPWAFNSSSRMFLVLGSGGSDDENRNRTKM